MIDTEKIINIRLFTIAAEVDGQDVDVQRSVRKAAYGLRLIRGLAMSIDGKPVSAT